MPVRELAPALLSLAEMFTAASLVTFPNREPVALNIKATKEGSFDIDLIAWTVKAFDDVIDLFSSNPMQALEGLVFSIVGAKKGLFWLIGSIGSKDVVGEDATALEPGHVTLTLGDGTKLEGIPTDVVALYRSLPIRQRARDVVAPLHREGIDKLYFKVGPTREAEVEKQDLPAYEVPPADENVELDVIQDMVLDVVSPLFEQGKWRFFDGDRRFSAEIDDPAFHALVDAAEPFSKGDTLRCDVRVIQSRTADGKLHIERRIVKVKHHHHVTEDRLSLDDQGGNDDAT
jgi:hypothetical protein